MSDKNLPYPDGAAGELFLPLNLKLTLCFDLPHMPDAHREKISGVLGQIRGGGEKERM